MVNGGSSEQKAEKERNSDPKHKFLFRVLSIHHSLSAIHWLPQRRIRREIMILIIKHVESEGPARIGEILGREGFALKTIALAKGDRIPDISDDLEAVISLGGPMNVYEEDRYPFLRGEDAFVRTLISSRVPFLGICLGAQILAKACGGRVTRAPREEIGWLPVALTNEGVRSPLFSGFPDSFTVFQWHGDTFEVPQGGTLLVEGSSCRNQAFCVGDCAFGLQFHIEVTEKEIADWTAEYLPDPGKEKQRRGAEMVRAYARARAGLEAHIERFCWNFMGIIRSFRKKSALR
jgi:GMP synthase-like glutamine amidotransferase